MRALVCGGRDYADKEFLFSSLTHCKKWWNLTTIIHGGAKGADSLAGDWAEQEKLNIIVIKANWDLYGKSAGMIRNKQMLELKPNVVIAFDGGAGTENMITISRKAGVPVLIL